MRKSVWIPITLVALGGVLALLAWSVHDGGNRPSRGSAADSQASSDTLLEPRREINIGGFSNIVSFVEPWPPQASLADIGAAWEGAADRGIETADQQLSQGGTTGGTEQLLLLKSQLHHYQGKPRRAYEVLAALRERIDADGRARQEWWSTVVFLQGVTGLRIGETENCIACRGASSCILPIASEARHEIPEGSQLAVRHFREYLEQFPDDLEARWLLNLAHMTLGEYPDRVEPKFLLPLETFVGSTPGIGRFRDIATDVGVDRFDQAGGAIMDDFDRDGLLDLIVSTMDPTQPLGLYRNCGDGTFRDSSAAPGLPQQLGGLYCVQADYNCDGFLDVFIPRGAWLQLPIRPTLLRNDGDGGFTDVTADVGLLHPLNSISATWADFDRDGWLDLFVCCEQSPSRLYRNTGQDSFEEVSASAGVELGLTAVGKGAAWIDIDNDDAPDLFVTDHNGNGRLFRNLGDGGFRDSSRECGIDGPYHGFSCWAWDYDNDGWLDIFATSYDRTTADVVSGLLGQSHGRHSNRLFHNLRDGRFEDRTADAGLDVVLAAMGSNFADFNGDGWLDMYFGTGDPSLSTLVPNRMFQNVNGAHFVEVTGPSGTGQLQKGHSVACGDWDRDGSIDLYVQMGGALDGDRYHNVLFQNPGHGGTWITVRLIGCGSDRSGIGARIRVDTAGPAPLTIHRHVSSGSSFGANPLELTVGLGAADRVAELSVHWPTTGATQQFRNVPANTVICIAEADQEYRILPTRRLARAPFRTGSTAPPP